MESNNTKQAAWVALGSLFSFGFGIVSSMILSRYFDKGDYGTYKQVMYVYNTLLVVFTLGLPRAYSYFLPRVELRQARNLINKITKLFFILGGIASLLLLVLSSQISKALSNTDLDMALKIFSIVPFLMLPTMGLEGILATYKKTKFMAIYVIVTRCTMLLCVAIPVLLWEVGYIGAIIGFVVASVVAFVLSLLFRYIPVKNTGNEKCSISYKEIFHFSLPLMYASIWAIIINSADQFFISRYFGKEVFAEFANGWMELPFIGMITGACATVLSPIFSQLSYEKVNPREEIYPLWMSVFEKSVMLIYPLLMYSCFFADTIMTVLYGKQYEISGVYFILKNLSCFFSVIVFAPLIINIGKVKIYSNVQMYGAILLLLLELIVVLSFRSVYLLASISTLCCIGRIFWLLGFISKYFNVKLRELFPIKLIMKILIGSIVILTLLKFFTSEYINNDIIKLLLSFFVFVVGFLVFAYFSKIDYKSLLTPLLEKYIKCHH